MSRPNQRGSSTLINRKQASKTPPKNDPLRRTQPKSFDSKKRDSNIHEVALHEKDERFRYLMKHGQLKKIEKGGNIIFSQLPQIPNVWVCYRRPVQRDLNIQKLSLDNYELTHVPLLEGEQRLKMLTFQHNKLAKIQNLISLPNLMYLDIHDNLIRQIQNLNLPTLKVLLLAKNQITKIKGLNQVPKLQVLDLHTNKISKIQNISLTALRILNLAHNQIVKMQNLQTLTSLAELNLKGNLIITIQGIYKLIKLQKCFFANNRIEIRGNFQNCELVKLPVLHQLTLQNNPCAKQKDILIKNIHKYMPGIKLLDGKVPQAQQSSGQQQDHEQVLKLIKQQWVLQKKRVNDIQNSSGNKKDYLKTTMITGGHAEIQDENKLFNYGNSYEIVLSNSIFQQNVQKIRFQYIFIQFLIQQNILQNLKKFKKLKILQFGQCQIMSLLQIAKLQNLPYLKAITIQSCNPIAKSTFIKQFIIYRFPGITQINRDDVKEQDRARAKNLFHHFDRVLQIPEKVIGADSVRCFPCQDPSIKRDKNYIKTFGKIAGQVSQVIVSQNLAKCQAEADIKSNFNNIYDKCIKDLIARVKIQQNIV